MAGILSQCILVNEILARILNYCVLVNKNLERILSHCVLVNETLARILNHCVSVDNFVYRASLHPALSPVSSKELAQKHLHWHLPWTSLDLNMDLPSSTHSTVSLRKLNTSGIFQHLKSPLTSTWKYSTIFNILQTLMAI